MRRDSYSIETVAAWALALLWLLPLAYSLWSAFHPSEYATRFDLTAPLTFANFIKAWNQAPFARYYLNTVMLVSLVLAGQLVIDPGRDLRIQGRQFGVQALGDYLLECCRCGTCPTHSSPPFFAAYSSA